MSYETPPAPYEQLPSSANPLLLLAFGGDLPTPLLAVSYAGGVFQAAHDRPPLKVGTVLACVVRTFDRRVAAKVRILETAPRVRFAFIHETAEVLELLRDLIEPIRSGRRLAAVPSEDRAWHFFRGDGATTLSIGPLAGVFSFSVRGRRCEVRLGGGTIEVVDGGIGSRQQILRFARLAMGSIPERYRLVIEPLLVALPLA